MLFLKEFLISIVLCLIIYYLWTKRWQFYYGSKLPGSFEIPLIGTSYILLDGPQKLYTNSLNIVKKQPPLYRTWQGPFLYVVTSRPQDIEILLPKFLEKGSLYNFMEGYFQTSSLTAPS